MKKTIIKRKELTKNDFSENTTIPSCFLRKTALSEKLFSRNKANFEKLRINTSTCMRKAYSNLPPKPTKPQSQSKPISYPPPTIHLPTALLSRADSPPPNSYLSHRVWIQIFHWTKGAKSGKCNNNNNRWAGVN